MINQNSKLFIPVILGTAREGRRSEAPAKFILDQLKMRGVEAQLIDPRDYNCDPRLVVHHEPKMPKEFVKWSKIAAAADGFIIVSPEYNHGYPGVLKTLLDELYDEYNYKPVGIAGVSTGVLGGARVVEQLRLVAIELKMIPMRDAVYFSKIKEINFEDHMPRLNKMLDELIWYAQVMKTARGQRESTN